MVMAENQTEYIVYEMGWKKNLQHKNFCSIQGYKLNASDSVTHREEKNYFGMRKKEYRVFIS